MQEKQPALWDNKNMPATTMSEQLTFTYHGERVDEGSIDMAEYGQALIGYSTIINATITTLNPNLPNPTLRITKTQPGSFIATIAIEASTTWWESLKNFFTSPEGQAITGISTILGASAITISQAIRKTIALAKKVGTQHIAQRRPIDTDSEEITLTNGTVIIEKPYIVNVYMNEQFRRGMRDVLQPTLIDGIDSVAFDDPKEEPQTLTPDDLPLFRSVGSEEIDADVTVETTPVHVEQASFESRSWRFVTVENKQEIPVSFTATVDDTVFLQRINDEGLNFKKGDILWVDLECVKPRGKGAKRKFTIVKVARIDRQDNLPGI
ncbi:hypothetical protein [Actinotignum urinale]|uniref:Uncharacterized protein n=1 Tax=Actinotignum urinale TaxID=190146 RepID=A0ABU5G506_9ACTO|nr:hypothetical protein [Actinotignum urinale]MDY5132271.1 hypothetical protein [Actinotignum urinale]